MDIQVVSTLIGAVGFPIVACIALALWVAKKFDTVTTMVMKTVENNTKVVAILCTKLGVDIPLQDMTGDKNE